ncbi:ATP-dependent RNA helicase [Neophaeococcomyces mojaviensis]|uniref:ATP-dependent RNA helicase n=1 Tax=Neophaeococcomyces mojaviensis TaxID=3383035 RepID=A0ACC3AFG7_9EURO|nr:ATP-dependent RNA helicase [Knufia sp. JES_112]
MSQGVKRKRLNSNATSRKRTKSQLQAATKRERGPAVRSDGLKWKEVAISKLLDDAEGFYGLEEIEDVEVVKDENGKGVVFKPVLSGNDDTNETGHDLGDDEWAGFGDEAGKDDDDDAEQVDEHEQKSKSSKLPLPEAVSGSRDQEPQDHDVVDDDDLSDDVDFNVLNGEASKQEIDMSAWSVLHLSPQMLSALSSLRFTTPTRIQQAAIPSIIAGNDFIGKAVTGSGKTLAFGVPVIESWLESQATAKKQQSVKGISTLILAPTRELAHQISKHLTALCEGLDQRPRLATVTGGLSVLKQQRQLETANIVVATPGRLWEVIQESSDLLAKLKSINFLVVDEADRLLSEGHFQEVEEILDALDREVVNEDEVATKVRSTRQTLVFSATFHKSLQQKLASKQKKRVHKDNNLLTDKQSMEYLMHKLPFQAEQKPVFVDANPESQLAENLSETILECGAMQKDLYLYTYLLQDQHRRKKISPVGKNATSENITSRILVFTNSVSAVKRLVPLLQSLNLPQTSISPLHSNMPQKSRLRSLERFSGTYTPTVSAPTTSVLIATDVAARGLDIKGINTIVHYHVPRTADTYVHRSGRTARVNNSGSSILLCSPDETASVTKLIAKIHGDSSTKSAKDINTVDRMYLPGNLIRQIESRVELAQKIVELSQSTVKVKSEDNWLRTAADELGVDYDSEEFEAAGRQARRGRGGGKERHQKKAAEQENRQSKVTEWKARLKDELQKRIDFGDSSSSSMKYLAGGAFDVDKLLAERAQA